MMPSGTCFARSSNEVFPQVMSVAIDHLLLPELHEAFKALRQALGSPVAEVR